MVNRLEEELEDIKVYAVENDIPIMEDEGIHFLIEKLKEMNCHSCLEIGSAIGYSAIIMASLAKDIKVTTIERDRERYKLAAMNIEQMNLASQIDIYCADALHFDTVNLEKEYDLIFIDAAKAQYQKFFEKYENFLADNGTIIVDNIDFHGFVNGDRLTNNRNTRQLVNKIRKFIDWLKNNASYNTEYHKIGDGIFVVKRKV